MIKISDFKVGKNAVLSILKVYELTDPIIVPVEKVGTKYVHIDRGRMMRFTVPDWKEEPLYLTVMNEAYQYVLFRNMEDYKRLANRLANIQELLELKRKLHILSVDILSDEQLDIMLNAYRKIYMIEKEKKNG